MNRKELFEGMPKEDIEMFNKLLPFEDNTPKKELLERLERLPKEQAEILNEICRRQYARKINEAVQYDKEIHRKKGAATLKALLISFMKTPVAKLLYLAILCILAAQLLR